MASSEMLCSAADKKWPLMTAKLKFNMATSNRNLWIAANSTRCKTTLKVYKTKSQTCNQNFAVLKTLQIPALTSQKWTKFQRLTMFKKDKHLSRWSRMTSNALKTMKIQMFWIMWAKILGGIKILEEIRSLASQIPSNLSKIITFSNLRTVCCWTRIEWSLKKKAFLMTTCLLLGTTTGLRACAHPQTEVTQLANQQNQQGQPSPSHWPAQNPLYHWEASVTTACLPLKNLRALNQELWLNNYMRSDKKTSNSKQKSLDLERPKGPKWPKSICLWKLISKPFTSSMKNQKPWELTKRIW
jgi:hypothetical protein